MVYSSTTQRYRARLRRKVELIKYSWINPLQAHGDHILEATAQVENATKTVYTFAHQPDFPRLLTIAGGAAGQAGNVVITGLDVAGNVISDTIALNAKTTVVGVKAFAQVTKIVLPKWTAEGDTVVVGIAAPLGLEECLSQNSVVLCTCAGAYETTRPTVTVSATVLSQNTVSFATAPDGSNDYVLYAIADK
jgi:hypothetical protein